MVSPSSVDGPLESPLFVRPGISETVDSLLIGLRDYRRLRGMVRWTKPQHLVFVVHLGITRSQVQIRHGFGQNSPVAWRMTLNLFSGGPIGKSENR